MRRHDLATWQQRVRTAPTVRHVLVVANEFLQGVNFSDRAFLPESCKPRTLQSTVELNDYAYDLKLQAARATNEARDAAAYLAIVLSDASIRLAELTGPHRPLHLPDSELKRSSSA